MLLNFLHLFAGIFCPSNQILDVILIIKMIVTGGQPHLGRVVLVHINSQLVLIFNPLHRGQCKTIVNLDKLRVSCINDNLWLFGRDRMHIGDITLITLRLLLLLLPKWLNEMPLSVLEDVDVYGLQCDLHNDELARCQEKRKVRQQTYKSIDLDSFFLSKPVASSNGLQHLCFVVVLTGRVVRRQEEDMIGFD